MKRYTLKNLPNNKTRKKCMEILLSLSKCSKKLLLRTYLALAVANMGSHPKGRLNQE